MQDITTDRPEAIDIHAHVTELESLRTLASIAPDHAPELTEETDGYHIRWPDGRTRGPLPPGLLDVSVRLRDMAAGEITHQALSGWTTLYFYRLPGDVAAPLIAEQNDGMLRIARAHPGRFTVLLLLPFQDTPASVREIERLASEPLVTGVGIGSNVAGRNLDDESLEPIWEAAQHHGLPVLVHPPGEVAALDRLKDYHLRNLIGNPLDSTIAAARLALAGVLDRYPRLRFCFVHGGGFAPYQIGRWDHAWGVRTDTSSRTHRPPSEFLRRQCFWDSLTHSPESLSFLGTRFGWSRVVIGTDYPWDMGVERPVEALRSAGLSAGDMGIVCSATARAFLRWPGDE